MYPSGELNELALRKSMLRLRIAGHRWQCVETGAELARPLAVVDNLMDKWRGVSPIAKVLGPPLALMLMRRFFRRMKKIAAIARYLPLVMQGVRMAARWRSPVGA